MIGWFRKALERMVHSAGPPFFVALAKKSKIDYQKEIGSGIEASVIMSPIQWIQRAFPEAPLILSRDAGDNEEPEKITDHEFVSLLEQPNDFYSGFDLWAATLYSYCTAGNAYWLKTTTANGRLLELWYVPHWLIRPKWPQDGSEFISYYEYSPGQSSTIKIDPLDVVHFRHGIDPRNTRIGLSPLHAALPEIFGDMEAAKWIAALLKNEGVPGVIVSPDSDQPLGDDEIKAAKKYLMEELRGERRGLPLVMGAKTKVEQYGFDPRKMDLSVTRDVAEERCCAALGIPSAVVGFGTGMQQTKVGATMTELRKLAWLNGIIPLHRNFTHTLKRSVLNHFTDDDAFSPVFDTDDVAALEDDVNKRAERIDRAVQGGWMRVDQGQSEMGFEPDESQRGYLRRLATVFVPANVVIERSDASEGDEDPTLEERSRQTTQARRGGQSKDAAAQRIGAEAERGRPTQAQAAFSAGLEQQQDGLSDAMRRDLVSFFTKLGRDAADEAGPIVEGDFPKQRSKTNGKQISADSVLADRIMLAIAMDDQLPIFRQVYERHYLNVATANSQLMDEIFGLAVGLPDEVARAVVATGGRRAGLVDLTRQTREALFDVITEARAEGIGVDSLKRRIRDVVSAGPWRSADIRGKVIARTEIAFAQNMSTIERARFEQVDRFLVFDAQGAPGTSDPDCEFINGAIVSAIQAEELANSEHPNGTRNFSPMFEGQRFAQTR